MGIAYKRERGRDKSMRDEGEGREGEIQMLGGCRGGTSFRTELLREGRIW